jgi:hypothetical protein
MKRTFLCFLSLSLAFLSTPVLADAKKGGPNLLPYKESGYPTGHKSTVKAIKMKRGAKNAWRGTWRRFSRAHDGSTRKRRGNSSLNRLLLIKKAIRTSGVRVQTGLI